MAIFHIGSKVRVTFQYLADMCANPNMIQDGYDDGVPMGGDLKGSGDAPRFVLSALREPDVDGSQGVPLWKLQIIKGWVSAEGDKGVKVFDVATDTGNYTLNENTCDGSGSGADSLCAFWEDPDFDPQAHAYYYARVVEYPRCRWSYETCIGLPADSRPEACSNVDIRKLLRERAWTSPIWYSPQE